MPFKDTESLRSLKALIREQIAIHGPTCDLNHIDVSQVTSMSGLFEYTKFNGDISKWNVSNVTCMERMFFDSRFNGDISNWNVSKVNNMAHMFTKSSFNGDVSRWNTERLGVMSSMFYECPFQGDLSKWKIPKRMTWPPFERFHDSPLGYLGVLENMYDFPKEDPRVVQFEQFEQLRSLCDGLKMNELDAASFIYQEMHQPHQIIEIPTGIDLSHENK